LGIRKRADLKVGQYIGRERITEDGEEGGVKPPLRWEFGKEPT
jgi:hypothetical protein